MKKIREKIKDIDFISNLYIGYGTRLLLSLVLFITFLFLGLLFFFKSLDFIEEKSIKYTEKSNLEYKVYLKENDFYEEDFLGKDMLYVASLIDRVNVEFDYNFSSFQNVDIDFQYDIVAKLMIRDSGNKISYFEKEYVLVEDKKVSLKNKNSKNINEIIDIDYDYYNLIANSFKTNYGVDTSSNLLLYLVIDKNSNNKDFVVPDDSIMSINIPLSERSIDIKMDYNEINNSNKIIDNSNVIIKNIIYFVLSCGFVVLSLVLTVRIVRLLMLLKNRDSKYDKYIKKLLIEYDRLIVATNTGPDNINSNIIEIYNFQELLDVRDNLKLPIMFFSIARHQKCCFYISHDNKTYLHVVKAVDIEDKKNEKVIEY